jgi:hypothetical protein
MCPSAVFGLERFARFGISRPPVRSRRVVAVEGGIRIAFFVTMPKALATPDLGYRFRMWSSF